MRISTEFIHNHGTTWNSWTTRQIAALGEQRTKGWLYRAANKELTVEQVKAFLNYTPKRSLKMKSSNWKRIENGWRVFRNTSYSTTTKDSIGKIPFGKHKGKYYIDLPVNYLEWAAENFRPGFVLTQIQIALASKKKPKKETTHPVDKSVDNLSKVALTKKNYECEACGCKAWLNKGLCTHCNPSE